VCLDFVAVKILDGDRHNVTPASRKNEQTALVEMRWDGARLAVAKNGSWSGSSICS
jgi:hypothetical protein